MRPSKQSIRRHTQLRRGAVAPLVAVSMAVMLSFVALSVDYGYLAATKAQLQNAADAAALAGASAYFSNAGLRMSTAELTPLADSRAKFFSVANKADGAGVILADADVRLGQHDFLNRTGPLLSVEPWNAVQVTARKTADSPNGPVSLFFARIFGQSAANVSARARAVANDHVAGYHLYKDGIFLPFTIHVDKYNEMLASGPDGFSFDSSGKSVTASGDGVREVVLYPWKWDTLPDKNYDGTDSEGSGNFGTLTVGLGSQGTSFLEEQITNGITAQELIDCFGTDNLIFYDDEHTAATGPRIYQAPGNPGLSAGMADSVRARIGDIIGYFINNGVVDNGSGATYYICGIAFGRIMDIRLTGGKNHRQFVVQPTAYFDEWVRVDDSAPSSGNQVGHVSLVQ
jgi:Flp pilus assembly protein TadG